MKFPDSAAVSRFFFYPLWDVYDRSVKLQELKKLRASQWETPDKLKVRQWNRLKEILSYARRHCPF